MPCHTASVWWCVLHQVLRNRYERGEMYTSIGPVLIAVNPYKQLSMGGKGIYTSGVRDYYHRKVTCHVRSSRYLSVSVSVSCRAVAAAAAATLQA